MTAHPARQRTRLLGTLGLALSAILSPSGKIISGAVASTLLVGGVVTHLRPPTAPAVQALASTPVAPTGLAHSRSSAPNIIYDIEVDGQRLPVVLTADAAGGGSAAGHGQASGSPALGLSGGNGHVPNTGSPRGGPYHGSPALPGPRPGAPAASEPDGSPPAGDPPSAAPLLPLPPVSPTAPPDSPPIHGTPKGECTASPDRVSPNASPREVRPGATPPAGCDDPAGHDNPSEADAPATPPQEEAPSRPLEPSLGDAPVLPDTGSLPDPILLAGRSDPAGNEIPGNTPAGAGAPSMPHGGPLDDLILEPIRQSPPTPPEEGNSPPGQGPAGLPTLPAALPADLQGVMPLDAQEAPQVLQSVQSGAAAVPEPSTIGLMLLGVVALAWAGRPRPAACARRA